MPESPERGSIGRVDKARITVKKPCSFNPVPEQLKTGVEFCFNQIFIYGHRIKVHFRLIFEGRGKMHKY